ncbi:hypothetical protein [Sphingobium cupriresistens]|uniref:Uncharacterized protein n=1 Tax=Sphingobium cupriresistens TaxID=1132417 RepID=A0A8G1ZJ86_9SPHN|nr:hypothetical protein [Sphingobium cupriresistens]RYM07990.1 hypothetical protein EWH12_17805 [Sphingobium cupriresistens]
MIETIYEFPRGSTIRVPIDFDADDGETMADIDLIEADLRFADYKPADVTEDMPKQLACTIEARGDNAGWFVTVEADRSSALPLGYYVFDVRLTVGGAVTIGQPAAIKITEPVTRRPEE